MAGVYTYKHTYKTGEMEVTIPAIDHSVGRGGVNRMDDVQLIQVLINRFSVYAADVYDQHVTADYRVADASGRQISKLKIDGLCGPLTLAAIVAVQKSMRIWRSSAIDGRIDPIKEGGKSQYVDRAGNPTFSTMHLLGVAAEWKPNPRFDVFALPDPLKSSLMRATMGRALKFLAVSLDLQKSAH